MRPTYVQVDLHRIKQNISAIQSVLSSQTGILAVVKAEAYGHGILAVAQTAVQCGVKCLGVAIPEEGAILRQAGILTPILVLGAFMPCDAELIAAYDLMPTIFTQQAIQCLEEIGKQKNIIIKVHMKIETGMQRIGVNPDDAPLLIQKIKECSHVHLEGVFTHLASVEDDEDFTLEQNQLFLNEVNKIKEEGLNPLLHAANSAAAFVHPHMHNDFVRIGIAMYGYLPNVQGTEHLACKPALKWLTHVTHVKQVQSGDTIGYHRNFKAQHEMRVATLPVGYADGYNRLLSNRGFVLIRGMRAPIIGLVCMDQCMVDVSHIPDVCVGDETVLLGEQNGEHIYADEIAKWIGTISYEVLTSISARVPRVYVGGEHVSG